MKASFLIGFVSYFGLISPAFARDHWTELNIGPFFVDVDGDVPAGRDALTQLEQLRWVLGGLLESKDLPSVWPIRVILSRGEKTKPLGPGTGFVSQNGQFLFLASPHSPLPLGEVAGILLDANTPRLPLEIESGVRQLFSTIDAHSTHVMWGAPPAHPDLNWARMQLLATQFEYSAGFHIFLSALRDGSTMRVAERNAFGKESATLEEEAKARFASHHWQAVPVSGRPLDPKRDFGEHALDETIANVYVADAEFATNPKAAEPAYKAAIEAGGLAAPLGYEGLAREAKLDKEDPKPFWEHAIKAGSKSAPVYVGAAERLPDEEALPLLKKAAELNPLWGEPVFLQAQATSDLAQREVLLKKAVHLDPRLTTAWIALANTQTADGHALDAQGTWLRAEGSAQSPEERNHIHQLRLESEQQRLDAAEAARRHEREAAHLDDARAQDAESSRIREAERRANEQLDASGNPKPEQVVPWEDMVRPAKIRGTLIRVDCISNSARIAVKDGSGKTVKLFLKNPAQLGGACQTSVQARRVLISYSPREDESLDTSGDVLSITLQ